MKELLPGVEPGGTGLWPVQPGVAPGRSRPTAQPVPGGARHDAGSTPQMTRSVLGKPL